MEMSSVLERPVVPPEQQSLQVPRAVKRFGYLLAAIANSVLLWVAHQLVDWGWPSFLTADFEMVLGLVTAALIAGIAVDLLLMVHHEGRLKVLTDLVTAGFALAVGLRMLEVFPFDFAGYANDWSGLVLVAVIVGIAAAGIAVVVNVIQLVPGPDAGD